MFFFVFLNVVFLFFFHKNVQNFKYDAFLMGKDSISWPEPERVFCSSIRLLIRPPVRSNGRSYKMLVMFLFFRRQISELPRLIAAKLRHMIGTCVYFINWLQKFGELSPLKYWGPKTCKTSVDFIQPPTLITNISGTAQDIQNLKTNWSTAIPLALHEKGPVNFGPLITKTMMWVRTH